MPTDHRARLQTLLRELFQFDSADLDFGIYRIMNLKRDEVERFIQKDLLDAVSQAFEVFTAGASKDAERELETIAKRVREAYGEAAIDIEGNIAVQFQQLPLALQYTQRREEAHVVAVSAEQEAQVFNDLYTFFNRYYSEGDFITRRRYGRGRYAIPYNGEEVLLHWANRDQYYVKTAETFRDYTFRVQPGGFTVHFKLTAAQTEQNNVKGENRFFLPRADSPVAMDNDAKSCTIFFEYRPSKDEEKESYGKTKVQDAINAEIAPKLLKAIPHATLRGLLAQIGDDEQTSLARHLSKYTRRNTSDYFIHKDLRGFLTRELDYFIKSEVFNLDDLGDDEQAAEEPYRRLLARARVIRQIGRRIIDFLAQIEDFQKHLFEKRKFVVQAYWCITLDRVPAEFYSEIAKNDAQWAEWERLFKIKRPKRNGKAAAQFLKDHPTLTLDTQFFDADFKDRLLATFDDLDTQTDGLLIHSENFQALNLLLERYRGQVKCIYIDPPYNTGSDGFIYKDNFQHSSWLAMIEDRMHLAQEMLSEEGVIFISIDDGESGNLRLSLDQTLQPQSFVADICVVNNLKGRNDKEHIATANERLLIYKSPEFQEAGFELTGEQRSHYSLRDGQGNPYRLLGLRKRGGADTRALRPNLYFPIYADPRTGAVSLVRSPIFSVKAVPLKSDGVEGCWRWEADTVRSRSKDLIALQSTTGKWDVFQIDPLFRQGEEKRFKPKSVWFGSNYSTDGATKELRATLPGTEFTNPKPVEMLESIVEYSSWKEDTTLDFFAGSGTTAHAVINLNRQDDGSRKYILVEMGEYFDTVLKPRLQKVIYASDWKDGQPVEGAQGSSHIFKYLRLESYEDALNNIIFDPALKPQLELLSSLTDYTLRYMLDVETRTSAQRLNVDKLAHPFDYTLQIARPFDSAALRSGDETRETRIDLVETFNYMFGLHVTRRRAFEYAGRTYRVVFGTVDHENVAVIWRDLEGLDIEQDRAFITDTILRDEKPDRVYVNGDSVVDGGQSLDPIFKQRMVG